MGSNYKMTYNVDMVFCIDCTGSMDNIIDIVKNNALNFYRDVTNVMEAKNKHITQLRVRVVAFRDYIADGEDAMLVTDFFKLPEESDAFEKCVRSLTADFFSLPAQSVDFERCVRSIEAFGGGDDPEDGLEALAYAIKSKWATDAMKKRQVIVVWTDAATHPLGFGAKSPYYPNGMAKDLRELTSWWSGGAQQNGFVDNDAFENGFIILFEYASSNILENSSETTYCGYSPYSTSRIPFLPLTPFEENDEIDE